MQAMRLEDLGAILRVAAPSPKTSADLAQLLKGAFEPLTQIQLLAHIAPQPAGLRVLLKVRPAALKEMNSLHAHCSQTHPKCMSSSQ
jgi:hypothetical protein